MMVFEDGLRRGNVVMSSSNCILERHSAKEANISTMIGVGRQNGKPFTALGRANVASMGN